MTLEEVQKEIDRLSKIKHELEEKEQEPYNIRATQYVGKCYRNSEDEILKIVEAPKKVYRSDFQWHYKKHHFIALYLRYASFPGDDDYWDDFAPFYYDEFYFDITQFETPCDYVEISQDEFNAELDKRIVRFKELINS